LPGSSAFGASAFGAFLATGFSTFGSAFGFL